MNRIQLSALGLAILTLSAAHVNAAETTPTSGVYAGASLGRTSFSADSSGLPVGGRDDTALAGKLYLGYRLGEYFGVEAGYARLGSLAQTVSFGNAEVTQTAKGRSLYTAVTGRMPVAPQVALTGKAGLSFGKVSGANVLPVSADLTGSRRSFMFGVGAEYQMSPQIALVADFDHFGKLSDKARANLLSAGMRYSF
jgi:OmpA-OmpF porin, OOP family